MKGKNISRKKVNNKWGSFDLLFIDLCISLCMKWDAWGPMGDPASENTCHHQETNPIPFVGDEFRGIWMIRCPQKRDTWRWERFRVWHVRRGLLSTLRVWQVKKKKIVNICSSTLFWVVACDFPRHFSCPSKAFHMSVTHSGLEWSFCWLCQCRIPPSACGIDRGFHGTFESIYIPKGCGE